jgi:hypothetical protein
MLIAINGSPKISKASTKLITENIARHGLFRAANNHPPPGFLRDVRMYKSIARQNHAIDPAREKNPFITPATTQALIPSDCSFVTALLTQNLFIGGPSTIVGRMYENSKKGIIQRKIDSRWYWRRRDSSLIQ